MDLPLPRLGGRHQHVNAGTAIAALKAAFGEAIGPEAIAKGSRRSNGRAACRR